MTEHKPKMIAVVGPTAAGKTSLGIMLAKQFSGEIISADSRQVYRGMDIGTAKASGEWRRLEGEGGIERLFQDHKALFVEGIPHWGIDIVDPDESFSAADFKQYTEQKIDEILARDNVPILVGGTGFWLKAVIDNFNLANTSPDSSLRGELESQSTEVLFERYKKLDPDGAKEIDADNKRKLIRALEVSITTGTPFSKRQKSLPSKYEVLQIGVKVDREELYERINNRVDKMVAQGLVDEVRELRNQYGCESEAMTGIGYRQICKFLNNEIDLEEAIRIMKRDTRHYAKRQMTWFKRDGRIRWIVEKEDATALVEAFLK